MSRASSPKTPPIMSPDAVSVSPSQDQGSQDSSQTCEDYNSDDDYFKPLKRLRMMHLENHHGHHGRMLGVPSPPPHHPILPPPPIMPLVPNNNNNNNKPPTSFSIRDILSHKPKRTTPSEPARIVRPWDLGGDSDRDRRRPRSADDDSRSESDCSESPAGGNNNNNNNNTGAANSSPLDALFEMTSKAFEGLNGGENSTDSSRDHLHIFSNRQQPKKKRKSRTAFTNHQIFELEKRFLYQKYLSPADRDEIAQSLGLTNAQVITWFQNRRAKLKRDMEELKKDVDSATKILPVHPHHHHHHNIMESIQDLSMMKADLVAKEQQE